MSKEKHPHHITLITVLFGIALCATVILYFAGSQGLFSLSRTPNNFLSEDKDGQTNMEIAVRHHYADGTHQFAGLFAQSHKCQSLLTQAVIKDSTSTNADDVILLFKSVEKKTACNEEKGEHLPFLISIKARQNISLYGVFNDEPVVIHLVEVPKSEELFVL